MFHSNTIHTQSVLLMQNNNLNFSYAPCTDSFIVSSLKMDEREVLSNNTELLLLYRCSQALSGHRKNTMEAIPIKSELQKDLNNKQELNVQAGDLIMKIIHSQ